MAFARLNPSPMNAPLVLLLKWHDPGPPPGHPRGEYHLLSSGVMITRLGMLASWEDLPVTRWPELVSCAPTAKGTVILPGVPPSKQHATAAWPSNALYADAGFVPWLKGLDNDDIGAVMEWLYEVITLPQEDRVLVISDADTERMMEA